MFFFFYVCAISTTSATVLPRSLAAGYCYFLSVRSADWFSNVRETHLPATQQKYSVTILGQSRSFHSTPLEVPADCFFCHHMVFKYADDQESDHSLKLRPPPPTPPMTDFSQYWPLATIHWRRGAQQSPLLVVCVGAS